eukprot:CAMPEP_0194069352 /NCGR_PEP_ID=MMETSP0009_2-20130614/87591_1 /TAXON_ID=210454 /ORGANISM="Grammatophora oceanica, Strain CCMP 410" /LENGTH=349 /DNA_ID=CAMNT_0038722527 /DNA_START=27 /DNA_END=1076 /DNA_ORIENTATION=+
MSIGTWTDPQLAEQHRVAPALPNTLEVHAAPSEICQDIDSHVKTLRGNLEDEATVEKIFFFLVDQISSSENETVIISAGDLDESCLGVIVEATKRYPKNDNIQGSAVWVLTALADYDNNRHLLVEIGGEELIAKLAKGLMGFVYKNLPDPSRNKSSDTPGATRMMQVMTEEKVKRLAVAMATAASACDVRQKTYCCRMIGNLTINPAFVAPIIKEGGSAFITEAMKRHPTDVGLQGQGCRALGFLGLRNENNARNVLENDGVEVVIAAMKQFPNDERVLQFACPTLESMGSAAIEVRERIQALKGVELARHAWQNVLSPNEKIFWRIVFPATMVDTRFIFTNEFLEENP